LNKELEKITKLLNDQTEILKGRGQNNAAQPMSHQRMGTTGADRTRGTMFEGGTSPENFNEQGPSSKHNGEEDLEI